MAKFTHSNHILKSCFCVTVVGWMMLFTYINLHTSALRQLTTLAFNHFNFMVHKNMTRSASKPLLVSPSPVRPEDLESIQIYHDEERRWCEKKIETTTGSNWCPCIPTGLQGRVFVNMIDDADWDQVIDVVGNDVLAGGEWKPENCLSRTRLAIVIPCRDREHHLRILLRHLIPILKRQLVHFRVFAVDQRFPAIFNKAATMNIGFLEAAKRFFFDCVIFHDVDMILEDDRTLMTCSPEPRHYARAVGRMNYALYPTFGGVVSITPELFRNINGYPLRYFGWGGEDDDMWSRLSKVSSIYMPPSAIARYSTIPHGRDGTNPENPRRHALYAAGLSKNVNGSYEGLSDLIYNVNDVLVSPLFTRIQADINITNMSSYPSHANSQYKRIAGICRDTGVMLKSGNLCFNSCRFLCDSLPYDSCFGFSHRKGICSIIPRACNLTIKDNTWTYVKHT